MPWEVKHTGIWWKAPRFFLLSYTSIQHQIWVSCLKLLYIVLGEMSKNCVLWTGKVSLTTKRKLIIIVEYANKTLCFQLSCESFSLVFQHWQAFCSTVGKAAWLVISRHCTAQTQKEWHETHVQKQCYYSKLWIATCWPCHVWRPRVLWSFDVFLIFVSSFLLVTTSPKETRVKQWPTPPNGTASGQRQK